MYQLLECTGTGNAGKIQSNLESFRQVHHNSTIVCTSDRLFGTVGQIKVPRRNHLKPQFVLELKASTDITICVST